MKTVIKILGIITVWILFGGMIAMAVIYNDVYTQIVIDTAIMTISALIGYVYKASVSKNQS